MGVARSPQWPSISAEAGACRGKVAGLEETGNSHAPSGSLSFELDLWGKYRRAIEAA